MVEKGLDVAGEQIERKRRSAPRPAAAAQIGSDGTVIRRQRSNQRQAGEMARHASVKHHESGSVTFFDRQEPDAAVFEPDLAQTLPPP